MADVRPFRGLRFDPARVDPAYAIAPPYDVISEQQQAELYTRSPHNIVRVEYGQARPGDTPSDNRYTRARETLTEWRDEGVLTVESQPAVYAYRQEFESGGREYARNAYFGAVRLEEWEKGVIKPHEHTLSGPKADRLELLRTTRTQVSPVYCIVRSTVPAPSRADVLYDFEADGQRHALSRIADGDWLSAFASAMKHADVYIADGHHRYETALTYRNEMRARAGAWTGEEPENFVLSAFTSADDPGLVVLPTHRVVNPPAFPADAIEKIRRYFDVEDAGPARDAADLVERVRAQAGETMFGAVGLQSGRAHVLRLRDRDAVEAMMPPGQPAAWRRLDVNVLQYGLLEPVFGIDRATLESGDAVRYTQDAAEALGATANADTLAFLMNATPVQQVMAVADAGGRMPQKSTYFYPKLPTGLVLRALDA